MKTTMKRLAVGAAAALGLAAQAQAADIQVGVLTCELVDKTNLILFSSKKFDCDFDPSGDAPHEDYSGVIDGIGVDLEVVESQQIVWLVLAPSREMPSGALAGAYVGASASASASVGVGANALIGGVDNSISLQPLSVSGSEGVGVAATISALTLKAR